MLLNCSDKKIDLNTSDNEGRNAFMLACNKGHTDVVKLLLNCSDKNIELNTTDLMGRSAFMLACIKGHKEVVQLLMSSDKTICLNTFDNEGIEVVGLLLDGQWQHLRLLMRSRQH